MNPRVNKVHPLENFKLRIEFKNGEIRIFDVMPYLGIGVFKELNNKELFMTAKENLGSLTWQNGQDFCADTIYLESTAA